MKIYQLNVCHCVNKNLAVVAKSLSKMMVTPGLVDVLDKG